MHRVLHVISGLGAGGAQNVLARLISGTGDQWRHRVVSLADNSANAVRDDMSAARIDGLGLRRLAAIPAAVPRLRAIVRDFQPSLIQGWMYHGNLAARACGTDAPVLWNIRHSPEGDAHQRLMTRVTVRASAVLSRGAAAIVFNSARSAELHGELGFATSRMHVIANGFNTRAFAPDEALRRRWRVARGIPDAALVIGHAARFHPVKNHVAALHAFAAIAAERTDTWLAMVGEGVNDRCAELRAAAAACRGRAQLLDRETNMADFYNGIDVLMLSSWAEAMPNVIGEAMACATPCITTDVGDAAALVGDTGWIAASPSVAALAVALGELSRAPIAHVRERGRRARSRIESEFSVERMIARYTGLYEVVLSNGCCGRS